MVMILFFIYMVYLIKPQSILQSYTYCCMEEKSQEACRQSASRGALKLHHGLVPLLADGCKEKAHMVWPHQKFSSSPGSVQLLPTCSGECGPWRLCSPPRGGQLGRWHIPVTPGQALGVATERGAGAHPSWCCRDSDAQHEAKQLREGSLRGCSRRGCSSYGAGLHSPSGTGHFGWQTRFISAFRCSHVPVKSRCCSESCGAVYIPEYSSPYFNLIIFFIWASFPTGKKCGCFSLLVMKIIFQKGQFRQAGFSQYTSSTPKIFLKNQTC